MPPPGRHSPASSKAAHSQFHQSLYSNLQDSCHKSSSPSERNEARLQYPASQRQADTCPRIRAGASGRRGKMQNCTIRRPLGKAPPPYPELRGDSRGGPAARHLAMDKIRSKSGCNALTLPPPPEARAQKTWTPPKCHVSHFSERPKNLLAPKQQATGRLVQGIPEEGAAPASRAAAAQPFTPRVQPSHCRPHAAACRCRPQRGVHRLPPRGTEGGRAEPGTPPPPLPLYVPRVTTAA